MRRVLHLGPLGSNGGMSSVINNMVHMPPNGWLAYSKNTHSSGPYGKFSNWLSARSELKSLIQSSSIDLVHVHVTHSLSWWRKWDMLKICEKMSIPSVVHIHSGRFQKFCKGFVGFNVKSTLAKKYRGVIVLEKRWQEILMNWLPQNTRVIRNFTPKKIDRSQHQLGSKIKLLILSRSSKAKGLDFAIEILRQIKQKGVEVELTITGEDFQPTGSEDLAGELIIKGWVQEEEKDKLIRESDFLLSPSSFEGASMSIIESMVSGLPCIVSPASYETVSIPELVVSEFLPELWCKKIIELHDRNRYNNIVLEIESAASMYDVNKNVESLGEFYNYLISRKEINL